MDHYQTLGVAKTATPDDIKKAYRKLASQHHPDKGGDTAMFQQIQTAYDTLSDPQKRQSYDNPIPQGMNPGGFGFNVNGFDINDLFGQMMRQQQANRGPQTYRTTVILDLEEAFNGGSKTLKIQTPTESNMVNINIPKGINTGDQIKYDNILNSAGLLVEFRIQPHLRYERNGNDLHTNQSISVLDLIAGGEFEFTTISGKTFMVTIPPKTQPYKHLKISGQGMPIYGTLQYGDQIILIKPFMPDIIDVDIINSIVSARNK
jgi:curved DNA-binding protein